MILHKVLRGDRAGIYLPFGLSRLRALASVYGTTGFFQEKFRVDGHTVEVQQAPPYQYVRVTEEGDFLFEFTTSGNPIVTDSVTQLGLTFESYKAATVKVRAGAESGTPKTPEIVNGTRVTSAANSTVLRQFQIELVNEPVAYPRPVGTGGNKRYPTSLYQCFAPKSAHTGVHLRNTSWGLDAPRAAAYNVPGNWMRYWYAMLLSAGKNGALLPHLERDYYYDVPYQDGQGTAPVRTAYLRTATPADWPRANGNQVVVDETYGSREFAIYVDAYNQFFVFPVGEIDPINPSFPHNQNVDAGSVQQATFSLPAGGYAPAMMLSTYFATHTVVQGLLDFPELQWKFSPDGTKAASILYAREPFDFDSAEFSTDIGSEPFDATDFTSLRSQLGVQGRNGLTEFGAGYNSQRYFAAPGIVEVTIDITLTGPDPEDFTASASLAVIRDPAVSAYCPMFVGYAWVDIAGKCTAGDLIAVDCEQWAEAGVRSVAAPLCSWKNLTTATEILCTRATGSILAVDLTTLSMAYRVEELAIEDRAGTDFMITHFAVVLVNKLAVKETLYPTTMTAPNRAILAAVVATFLEGATHRTGRYLVPLNESRDWTDPDLADLRAHLLGPYWLHHHATAPIVGAPGVGTPIYDAETLFYYEWNTYLPPTHLVYCDAPKFGWHLYADLITNFLHTTAASTFYTHPNGTYCFWDNAHVYNPQGVNVESFYSAEQYAGWDPEQLEHCIFDRVHLRLAKGGANTTFQALYNNAVTAGVAAGTLVDTFNPITDASLRATFDKDFVAFPGLGGRGHLRVTAEWDGNDYYLDDNGVQGGGAAAPFITAPVWSTLDPNFNRAWINPLSGASTAPTSVHKHVRFCNPMVLTEASA